MDEPKWMQIARAEIGVKETAGDQDNPRILEYHQHTSLHAKDDETPWCASFINWVFDKAGLKTTHRANARSFLSLPNKCELKPGALAVLWRASRTSASGHVGLVVDVRPEKGTFLLLGGNQGNAVSIQEFPIDRLIECRWPE